MTEPSGSPWVFCQRDGGLYRDGVLFAWGYSGHGAGKNNPAMEGVRNIGPIPRGEWTILGPPQTTATHGPYVIRLIASVRTDMLGRGGFLIHGDAMTRPGDASQGCIVLPLNVREHLWESGETRLEVVAEPPDDELDPDKTPHDLPALPFLKGIPE